MRMLFAVFTAILAFMPVSAQAGQRNCPGGYPCWGEGSKIGPPTECIVRITAPSIEGITGLMIRDSAGKSRWVAPRNKRVKAGRITHYVGCGWFGKETAEVYMCVYGPKGVEQYYSRRTRLAGELDTVLKTRRLEMCLLGPDCPKFVSP